MNRIILVLLLVFLVLTAYVQLPDLMLYDSKRILQIFILFLVGILVLFSIIKAYLNKDIKSLTKYLKVSKFPVVATAILFLAGIISVFLSTNIQFALLEFTFLFLLLSLAVSIAPRTRKEHYFLGRIILGTTLIYSITYIIVFFGNYISSFFNPMITLWPNMYDFSIVIDGVILEGKETLYFDHKRFFNHTQTWTIPILVGFTCYHRKYFSDQWVLSALLFLLTSLWWMLIFASGGRGSMLSLVLSVLVLALIWRKDLLPFLKYGASTLGAGGIFYFLLFKIIPNTSSSTPLLRSSDSGRLDMWQGAMESWFQNPLFGIGPMHYSQIVTEPYFAHPHNFYIQFLTEWGLIAFIALAFLIGFLVKHVINNYPDKNQKFQSRFLYISLSWALAAAFIHAFFSGVFHTPMSQIWFILICAWFLGFSRSTIVKSKTFAVQKYASVAYVILLTVLIFIIYDDIFNILLGYEDYISKYPDSIFYPRFWGQGLFE